MRLRAILKQQFVVKSMSIRFLDVPEHFSTYGKLEILICRKGRWSIFGYRKHTYHTYYRKSVSKINQEFLRLSDRRVPFIYSDKNWSVTYYPKDMLDISGIFLRNFAIVYLVVTGLINWLDK